MTFRKLLNQYLYKFFDCRSKLHFVQSFLKLLNFSTKYKIIVPLKIGSLGFKSIKYLRSTIMNTLRKRFDYMKTSWIKYNEKFWTRKKGLYEDK